MRKIRIVSDSSCDLLSLDNVDFKSAPMKVITVEKEFVDDGALDVGGMAEFFSKYKGKSKTSCPNVNDWLSAFGDADEVSCVTITSGLSGSYNASSAAKQIYEENNLGKKVYVHDTF